MPSQEITSEPRNWIWSDMNEIEREKALRDTVPFLERFIEVLKPTKQGRWVSTNKCPVVLVGNGYGSHQLCNITESINQSTTCNFISFGIDNDYSFDTSLAEQWHCHGFAADPTRVHPSQIHPAVTFQNIGAKMMSPNHQQKANEKRKNNPKWWIASVPAVKKFLNIEKITVLKMDCEGCEYSLARDALAEDPLFFHSVEQFTFEVHLNTPWVNNTETFYYYAQLFKMLYEAGLDVMSTSIRRCGPDKEALPPFAALEELNYPGQVRDFEARRSCQEYLFAKSNNWHSP
eukprot:CAMPEP_0202447372 /NCGR_PEP_ID=MMETSP1360-20130828/6140_1 /ASSEMBLY_ACC=CAM_ASM_000848 /TAXON_ID=515479 /ORGANISM="Licmophora paradoxa, Strain CCMP2313" /LENGTH=288 /DNA_ID=CAMNT_0049064443 /DNA_START=170 /DNA_END=1036 /DNA_ORIENTATION=-